MELPGHILREGKVNLPQIFEFNITTQESYFLFGDEIHEYMHTLHVRAVDLRSVEMKLERRDLPVGEERSHPADESAELLKWFGDQIDIARKRFAKHMSLAE